MSNIFKYAIVESGKVINIALVSEDDATSYAEQYLLENPNNQVISIPLDSPVGVAWTYDNSTFLPKKPYEKWILEEGTLNWIPPIPHPLDGKNYEWSDEANNWVIVQ